MDRILLIDDELFFREMYSSILDEAGYEVDCACCGNEGLSMLASEQYGLVITDLVMPDISGLDVLSRVRETDPSIDVILITGNADMESAIFALKNGARDYLVKPVNHDEFRHSVAQCLQLRLLLGENEELKNTLLRARDMLFIDDVSGLFNHRYLEVALDREMRRVERYASHLAVLFIDIDAFKLVNDIHGHQIGTQVLAEFGTVLKQAVRDVDIVIRYGGDEFTAILVETTCPIAGVVAERVRSQVEKHIFMATEGINIRLTCSIGYSCCPDDTLTKEKLLEMADNAMYAGKASGKNCINRTSEGL